MTAFSSPTHYGALAALQHCSVETESFDCYDAPVLPRNDSHRDARTQSLNRGDVSSWCEQPRTRASQGPHVRCGRGDASKAWKRTFVGVRVEHALGLHRLHGYHGVLLQIRATRCGDPNNVAHLPVSEQISEMG